MIRVLVVEDETLARQGLILTTNWEKYDMKVIGEAKDGLIGLELAKSLKPDVIITDIKMPNMDGLEMIKNIIENQDVVIIVISAFSEFEYAKLALRLGAIDYLLKPFDDSELENSLLKAKQAVLDKVILNKNNQLSRETIQNSIDTYLSKSDRSQHENMKRILNYIQDNYSKDISVSIVSDALNISESTIARVFRSESSYSFNDYVTMYRLKVATKMLEDPNIKIFEVANAVGYRDQRYFSSVFKKYIGVTPNYYKEQF